MKNFDTSACLSNPYDGSQRLWNVGFFFGMDKNNSSYRIYIDSVPRQWNLQYGPNSGTSLTDVSSGVVANLDRSAIGRNCLSLRLKGDNGTLTVNGGMPMSFTIPVNQKGNIGLGTAFTPQSARLGATTYYTDFVVYELP
ncbi:MAG: hypothetical protein Q7O66_17240 [Dehalococcoidia bacterium]|nr:hypothetical protein [Dehalococcoidia bacterium]